jgi:hypothetical protein
MSTPNLYQVHLTSEQRARLDDLTRNGRAPAKKILHARILLLADKDHPEGRYADAHIARVLGLHINSVARIRKLFALHGEAPALDRKPRATPPVPPTLSLLVADLSKRGFVTSVCKETVRKKLKKMTCSPGGSSAGASPTRTKRGS